PTLVEPVRIGPLVGVAVGLVAGRGVPVAVGVSAATGVPTAVGVGCGLAPGAAPPIVSRSPPIGRKTRWLPAARAGVPARTATAASSASEKPFSGNTASTVDRAGGQLKSPIGRHAGSPISTAGHASPLRAADRAARRALAPGPGA